MTKRSPRTVVTIALPPWCEQWLRATPRQTFATDEQKMRSVVELARENVERGTGGPFAAAVFDSSASRLVAVGVNVVVPSKTSLAHAETMALMLAQQTVGDHDLGRNSANLELFTSAQPCIQCFGSVWWSGVRRLVIAATREDVESTTGFREGPLPADWRVTLSGRKGPHSPITVTEGVLRAEAREVLSLYVRRGGAVYNPS